MCYLWSWKNLKNCDCEDHLGFYKYQMWSSLPFWKMQLRTKWQWRSWSRMCSGSEFQLCQLSVWPSKPDLYFYRLPSQMANRVSGNWNSGFSEFNRGTKSLSFGIFLFWKKKEKLAKRINDIKIFWIWEVLFVQQSYRDDYWKLFVISNPIAFNLSGK